MEILGSERDIKTRGFAAARPSRDPCVSLFIFGKSIGASPTANQGSCLSRECLGSWLEATAIEEIELDVMPRLQ